MVVQPPGKKVANRREKSGYNIDTGTDATSPKITLRGWQSAGHTQGTPGHLGFHFIQQLAKVVHTRFGAPHPAVRVLGQ